MTSGRVGRMHVHIFQMVIVGCECPNKPALKLLIFSKPFKICEQFFEKSDFVILCFSAER
jgi:hypothetical protein